MSNRYPTYSTTPLLLEAMLQDLLSSSLLTATLSQSSSTIAATLNTVLLNAEVKEASSTPRQDSEELLSAQKSTTVDTHVHAPVKYSPTEEAFLAEQFYRSAMVDYDQLFYGPSPARSQFQLEDEYWSTTKPSQDTAAESISTDEAPHTFLSIQYSAMVGARNEVDSETKRKFDMWIKFNPDLFNVYQTNLALTREVNYGPS